MALRRTKNSNGDMVPIEPHVVYVSEAQAKAREHWASRKERRRAQVRQVWDEDRQEWVHIRTNPDKSPGNSGFRVGTGSAIGLGQKGKPT
jgi:hypothetical protein